MLCFDVKIDKEATQYAEEVGVKIFSAEIIYHLFDNFTVHQKVCPPHPKKKKHTNKWLRAETDLVRGNSKCWKPNVSRPLPMPSSPVSLTPLPSS